MTRNAVRRRQIEGMREEWHVSAFENALEQFDAAARRLRLSANQIAMIKLPRRITEASLPVRMDDGTIRVFRAFRVQGHACFRRIPQAGSSPVPRLLSRRRASLSALTKAGGFAAGSS